MDNYVVLKKNINGDFPGKFISPIEHIDRDNVIVLCRILSVGDYTDMNGKKVSITEEVLASLADNYNNRLVMAYNSHISMVKESMGNSSPSQYKLEDWGLLPNQLNHNAGDVKDTVGRVIGKIEFRYSESIKNFALFARIKVSHHHNVFYVTNDLWRYLSVGFDLDNLELREISWVVAGADPNAYKVMGKGVTSDINLQKNINNDLVVGAYNQIKLLKKLILVEDCLSLLCKQRKINKADTYELKKKMNELPDSDSVRVCYDILSNSLMPKVNEVFYNMSQEDLDGIIRGIDSSSKRLGYKSP